MHDDRFIDVFNLDFKVRTLFRSNNTQINSPILQEYDIVVVSPISIELLELSRTYTGQKVGICWAVEINNSFYEKNEITFVKNTLKKFKTIIVDADYIAQQIRNRFQYNGSILKLYFGCDMRYFFQTKNKNYLDDQIRVCVTRKWSPLYNNELIIQALTRVRHTMDLEAVFTSEEKMLDSYHKDLVNTSSVKFRFTGVKNVTELAGIYYESDLYISAAWNDGISVSLLEAMGSGLICIVTDFPTNLEVIKNGVNGFIFKSGDVISLTNVLEQVLNLSKEERSLIARRAQEFIVDFADWQKNSQRLVKRLLEAKYAD